MLVLLEFHWIRPSRISTIFRGNSFQMISIITKSNTLKKWLKSPWAIISKRIVITECTTDKRVQIWIYALLLIVSAKRPLSKRKCYFLLYGEKSVEFQHLPKLRLKTYKLNFYAKKAEFLMPRTKNVSSYLIWENAFTFSYLLDFVIRVRHSIRYFKVRQLLASAYRVTSAKFCLLCAKVAPSWILHSLSTLIWREFSRLH